MEESQGKTHSEKKQDKELGRELKKLSEIQKSVQSMQAHIQFLLKREQDESKKIERVFGSSIKYAGNKICYVSTHLKNLQEKEQKAHELNQKKNQIKSIRERDLNSIKEARRQISQIKQNQRKQLRELSITNDEKIRRMKEEQALQNKERAIFIRKVHGDRIRQLKEAKEAEKQRRSEKARNKSYGKLATRFLLENQLSELKNQEHQITKRLKEKRQLQLKLKVGVRKISRMDRSRVMEMVKSSRANTGRGKENVDEQGQTLEESLIRQAVSRSSDGENIYKNL